VVNNINDTFLGLRRYEMNIATAQLKSLTPALAPIQFRRHLHLEFPKRQISCLTIQFILTW